MKRFFSALAAASLAYSFIEPHLLRVRHLEARLPDLPPECEGMRIAQLSDLHCSVVTSRKLIRRAIELCNAQKPDVIVLTGDYISRPNSYLFEPILTRLARPTREYAQECAQELAHLQAPEGVFAVRGNHDFAAGGFDVVDEMLREQGINVLVNASTRWRGVLPVLGLDDLRAGKIDIHKATCGIDEDEAHIILAHNPRVLHLLKDRNALILAGHTHGGQVHIPGIKYRRQPHDMKFSRFYDGWYNEGRAQMFVNVGVGSVHFPMRFNCPPEICIFTLRYSSANFVRQNNAT